MAIQSIENLSSDIQKFFAENVEYFERIKPVLESSVQIEPEATPNIVYFMFDDIVCGILKNADDGVDVISVPDENPCSFEIQFDDETVFLSVDKEVVINRIENLAEYESMFALAT
ncbi:MAG: hypothetical protein AAFW84_09810 [Cyanobacteria bacterium J06635_15]